MKLPVSLAKNQRLSRWISVDRDDAISLRIGKVELGQGAVTAIAAIAADELGVDLSRIRIVAGDTMTTPDEGYTAGSLSIEHGGAAVRWVGALVRMLFADAAAKRLGELPSNIRIEDGRFIAHRRNISVGYGELAGDVDLDVDVGDLPQPVYRGGGDRPELARLDLPAKLSGAAFIHDLSVAGMHHGRVLRPPHPYARLRSFDRAAVEMLPGIVAVVVDGSFVGVVAEREEQADSALKICARAAVWERNQELPPYDNANVWMEDAEPLSVTDVVRDKADKALPEPVRTHEAAYSRPYLAHASLAPSCALAQWDGHLLHVHSHSQGVFQLRTELATALGIPVDHVRVTHMMGAGCYGHNGADDVALDAALLARAAGRPVLCRWSRQDELTWSPFGAAMRVKLSASLDEQGNVVAWNEDIYSPPHVMRPAAGGGPGVNLLAAWHLANPVAEATPLLVPGQTQGDRNAEPAYRLGGRRISHHFLPWKPLRSSAMRALGAHCNVFAIESFVDELAAMSGADPLAWRLEHLDDPRARAAVESAAAASGWDPKEAGGEGVGRGIAFARYKNLSAYCAIVARVEVTDVVRVASIHAAIDCGAVVHRDGVLNQMEGGIVQALSWTLKEEVAWDADGLISKDWASYPIIGFRECPPISVEILDRPDQPPLGTGECAAGPTSAAIANAVHHALGVRIRNLPITVDRVVAAIHGGSQ